MARRDFKFQISNFRNPSRSPRPQGEDTSARDNLPSTGEASSWVVRHSPLPQASVTSIDRRLLAINSELSEIKYRLVVIDQRLSTFTRS